MAAIRWRWFRPGYWGWRWRSGVSRESKVVSALIGLGAVGVGGYLAADTLGGPTTSTESYETTVERVVTVRENGRLVRRPVNVVGRVLVTTSTRPDGTQVITRRIVSTVPVVKRVVRREVVTLNGKSRTVVETQSDVVTQTQTRDVTNSQTVTDQRTVTNQRTLTDQRTVTDQRTITNERPVTVTLTRPVTTVQTTTVVETVPTTVTETVGVTVTVPITISSSLPFGSG